MSRMNMGDVSYLLMAPQPSQPTIEFEFDDSQTNQSEQEDDQHLLDDLEDDKSAVVYYADSQTSSQDETEAPWNQSEESDHGVFEERLSDYEEEHPIQEERLSDYETTEYAEHELTENEHAEARQQFDYETSKFPKKNMPIHTERHKIGNEILPSPKPKPNIISNISIQNINPPKHTGDVKTATVKTLNSLHNKIADTSFHAAKYIIQKCKPDISKKSARVLNFSLRPDAKFELPIIKKAPIIVTNRSMSKFNNRKAPSLKQTSDTDGEIYTLEFPKSSIYVQPGPPVIGNNRTISQTNIQRQQMPLSKPPMQVLSHQKIVSPYKSVVLNENGQPLQGNKRDQKIVSPIKKVVLNENGQPLQGTKRAMSDQSVQKAISEPKQPKLEIMDQSAKSYTVVTSSETTILPKLVPKPVIKQNVSSPPGPQKPPENHKHKTDPKPDTNYDSDDSFELLYGFDENSQTLKAMVGSKKIENNNKIKMHSTPFAEINKSTNNTSQKFNASDVSILENPAIRKVTGKNIPGPTDRLVNQITKTGDRTVITKVLPRFLSHPKMNKKYRRLEKETNKIDKEQETETDRSHQNQGKIVNLKSNKRTSEEMTVAMAMQKLNDSKTTVEKNENTLKTETSQQKNIKHVKVEKLPEETEESKTILQFNSSLAKLFMECNIPLGVVEDKNFKSFVQLLKPEFVEKLPTSKELLQNILQL